MAFNYRHHYMMLSDSQKSLYELLYKKISSYSGNIKLPLVHSNELWLVFEAVLLDNPFMIQCDSYSYQKDLNKRRIIMMPDYKFPSRINAQYQAAISSSLAFVGAGQQKSDYDKALHIHDYILSNFTYDYSASENCHTALGLAVNKKGVCEGLAKYVKLAMDALSLKSIIVIGHARNPTFEQYENEAHAWNMVEVNGQWYHFDVTFDLTLKGKMHRYDYFLTGDEEVKKNHSFGGNYPRASTVPLDYYTVNGLSANRAWKINIQCSNKRAAHYAV